MGRIACNESISTKLTTDSGRAASQHSGYFALTEFLILPDLNGCAFFNAEFCIGHGCTLPEGEVLHSVFAAASSFFKVGIPQGLEFLERLYK